MYGHVYVARVALGAKMPQTVQAMLEAESYPGPSLIIAYSHCIAHGYDMAFGVSQQKLAVDSGVWPLYRFDPRRAQQGDPPHAPGLRSAAGAGSRLHAQRIAIPYGRARRIPEQFKQFLKRSTEAAQRRYAVYQQLAGITVPIPEAKDEEIAVKTAGAVGERHGPEHDIPGHEAPASVNGGSVAAERRHGYGEGAGGRRVGGDRPALAVRRADRSRAASDELYQDAENESSAEAASYFPSVDGVRIRARRVPEPSRRVKEAVRIPVIASLNGSTPGGWLSYGGLMEQGGADALELNVFHTPLDGEQKQRRNRA